MRSWSNIREAIGTALSVVFGLLLVLLIFAGPLFLIVLAVKTGRYVLAVAAAIAYLAMLILLLTRRPSMMMRDFPAAMARAEPRRVSPVDFSVFAPRAIELGRPFGLNVWVHLREQISVVAELAQRVRPSEPVGLRAGVPVELGAQIVLRLHLPTLTVLDELDEVTWTGQPANASFRVHVPPDTTDTVHSGHFDVFTVGIRIARVLFELTLSSEELLPSQRRLRSRLERLRTAFASYASADRTDVLGRIQGMKKIAPDLDVFLDALSLRSGELWESRLAEEVISKDIFYLFWSRSASKSSWVRREWQHALANRGLDYIDPVPLETPEAAPPPDALNALHFGDAFATYAFLQRSSDRKETGS